MHAFYVHTSEDINCLIAVGYVCIASPTYTFNKREVAALVVGVY